MAHSNIAGSTTTTDKIISSVRLPDGNTYEIHDPSAIHSAEELGLGAVMRFRGTVPTFADLQALTDTQDGDVWHVIADGKEYVRCDNNTMWEFLGSVHDASSSNHTHNVTVTGTNSTSAVTGKVTVPTYTATTKYIGASIGNPTITPTTDKVLGGDTEFTVNGGQVSTTKLKATVGSTTVGADGTASAITGFGTHTTATVVKELNTTTIKNPTVTAGSAASWSASVTNGVLSFGWTANTPTSVSTSNVTVATGAKSTATPITALGEATTATVLKGVKVTKQPTVTLSSDATNGDVTVATGISAISVSASGDDVYAMTSVSASNPRITMSLSATETEGSQSVVSSVSVGSIDVSLKDGIAAAQTWTQKTGTTGQPK